MDKTTEYRRFAVTFIFDVAMLSERNTSSNDRRIADIVERAFHSANKSATLHVIDDDSSKKPLLVDDDDDETTNCPSRSSRRSEVVRFVLLAQYVTSVIIVALYGLFVTLKSTEHLRFYVIAQTTSTLCTAIACALLIDDVIR